MFSSGAFSQSPFSAQAQYIYETEALSVVGTSSKFVAESMFLTVEASISANFSQVSVLSLIFSSSSNQTTSFESDIDVSRTLNFSSSIASNLSNLDLSFTTEAISEKLFENIDVGDIETWNDINTGTTPSWTAITSTGDNWTSITPSVSNSWSSITPSNSSNWSDIETD